jgi:Ca2+/Na+ antiporter
MTILAVGNCLLDFISNVSIARKGFPRMAISACLGSPLLALLLGVGIPSTITTARGEVIELLPTPQLVVIFIVIMSSLALTVLVAASFVAWLVAAFSRAKTNKQTITKARGVYAERVRVYSQSNHFCW